AGVAVPLPLGHLGDAAAAGQGPEQVERVGGDGGAGVAFAQLPLLVAAADAQPEARAGEPAADATGHHLRGRLHGGAVAGAGPAQRAADVVLVLADVGDEEPHLRRSALERSLDLGRDLLPLAD